MKYIFKYLSAIGGLRIVEESNAITAIGFCDISTAEDDDKDIKETPLIKEAYNQLNDYFKGIRREFDLPLKPQGTEFQLAVWNALLTIPYGETRSYKDIAEAIGKPKACRAVGMANNRNPIAIVVPCHRVIGADGKMVGYAAGLKIKERLLGLEKTNISLFLQNQK